MGETRAANSVTRQVPTSCILIPQFSINFNRLITGTLEKCFMHVTSSNAAHRRLVVDMRKYFNMVRLGRGIILFYTFDNLSGF